MNAWEKSWRTGDVVAYFVLVAALFLVFGQVLDFGFISIDDGLLVLKNPLIRTFDLSTLIRIFTSYDPELYVPVTTLSYLVDYMIGGLGPKVYHLQNLLLHTLSTLLVYRIFRTLRLEFFFALFGALFFALHPIQAETVAWVAARKDVLSTFFGLLTLFLFLRHSAHISKGNMVALYSTFVLGLMSKVTILLLPLPMYFLSEGSTKERLRTLAPCAVLSVFFGVIALAGKLRTFGAAVPLTSYPTLSLKALHLSILHVVWPLQLSPIYPENFSTILSAAITTITFILIAVALWNRANIYRVGISIFLVGILPSFLTFTKNGSLYLTSDRYISFAIIGLILCFLALTNELYEVAYSRFPKFSYAIPCVGLVVLFLCISRTILQVGFWRTNESLLRHVISVTPDHWLAYANLGAELREQGRIEEAIEALQTAKQKSPHDIVSYMNLASIYQSQGKKEVALAEYERAVAAVDRTKKIQADDLLAHYFLGNLRAENGDKEGALSLFREASNLGTDIAEAQYNLGVILHRFGTLPEALSAYQRATALDSRLTDAHFKQAEILAGMGMLPEALEALEVVLALDPKNESARMHHGKIEEILGR